MNAYNALLLDHFSQPRNVGMLAHDDQTKYISVTVGSIHLGYRMDMSILFTEHHTVSKARFKAYGNPYLIAGLSWLTEWLKGKTPEQMKHFSHDVLLEPFELPQTKLYVAILIEDMVHAIYYEYKRRGLT